MESITRNDLLDIREAFLKEKLDAQTQNIIAKVLKDVKNEAKVAFSYNKFFAVNKDTKYYIKYVYKRFREVFVDCDISLKIHFEGRLYKDDLTSLEVNIDWS